MKKKRFGAMHVLAALLVLSIIGNMVQYFQYMQLYNGEPHMSNSIVGTYVSGDQKSPDAEYYVFTEQGIYHCYKQLQDRQDIGEGKYMVQQDGSVYNLTPTNGTEASYIVHKDNAIYQFAENEVTVYEKLSDIPSYVNAHVTPSAE